MIEEYIENLVKEPSDENKQKFLDFITEVEFSLLEDASTLVPKSPEFFEKRREAFAYRRECAKILLNRWVSEYGSTNGCPLTYADTLIIPFQQIKPPK